MSFRIFYSNHPTFVFLISYYICYFIFHFDFERGEWRDNATWCNCRNCVDDEMSTVRQPQYASTSLSSCRTFLALRAFPLAKSVTAAVRVSCPDIPPRYGSVVLFRAAPFTRMDFSHHFYLFPSIDEFVALFLRSCCCVNDSKILFIVWSDIWMKIYQR